MIAWNETEAARRLGVRYPIVQGPFGSGYSSARLAAAVSNAGGLGSFGAQPLGPEQIGAVAAEIRGLTQKPFAMNLWVSNADEGGGEISQERHEQTLAQLAPYFAELGLAPPAPPPAPLGHRFEDQVEALLAAAPPVFSFIFGVPPPAVLSECRRRGIVTAGAATTAEEAVALEAAGVDLVVASGCEAGGHRGSFLRSAEESLTGTFALVPQLADAVRVPVLAAGGIADGRGVVAALALGAQGAQIGTAFLACEESAASPGHRAKLFSPDARWTTLTRAFTGRLARGLRNRLFAELTAAGAPALPYPMQGWYLQQLRGAAVAQGRTDLTSMWCGQAAPLLRHHRAAELMESLVAETEAALLRLGRG